MSHTHPILALLAAAAFSAAASDTIPELRIGLSPSAIAAKNAPLSNASLYQRVADGDPVARRAWGSLDPAKRARTLSDLAVKIDATPLRTRAIRDLARMTPSDDPENTGIQALARIAVAEGDGELRKLARTGLVARGDDRTARLLAMALRSEDGLVQANAVEALREIGGPPVFEVIVEKWKEVWGAGPRTHAFFGTVRSYIGDYDISGDSYDPVIRTVFSGTVLDTKVLKVERDIYYVWIRQVAGGAVDLPKDPAAWAAWVNREREPLAKAAEGRRAAAVTTLAELGD